MRILLIEDDEDVGRLVTSGWKRRTIRSRMRAMAMRGMSYALHEPFDVMIFDRKLPGGSRWG